MDEKRKEAYRGLLIGMWQLFNSRNIREAAANAYAVVELMELVENAGQKPSGDDG